MNESEYVKALSCLTVEGVLSHVHNRENAFEAVEGC